MISTFSFRAYLLTLLMIVLFIAALIVTIELLLMVNSIEYFQKILIFTIFNVALFLLIIHEFRNKIIWIIVISDQIEKSSYLAPNKIYHFKDFDGYQTRVIEGKFEKYEYLYLVKDGRKVVRLSQVYHKNYYEFKAVISKKAKNLGLSDYDLIDEILEIMTLNYC